jgi:exosortase
MLRLYYPLMLFAVLWIDLIRMLSYTWETQEQYSYGWFVPLFSIFLFATRWASRPGANQSARDHNHRKLVVSILVVAVVLVPLRAVFEINADWPLIAYAHSALVVVVSLQALYLAGGWPWVRHFLFPTAFILVAVAWPYRIEKGLTQNFMQLAAGLTVEILGLGGIPALQRGNLIELSTGVLGVDEACSGIRSFQSTFMASLLMGELYRFRIGWRLGFVGIGLIIAFTFNIIRTFLLSWIASRDGITSIDKWHDSAGLSITVACFFCLWLLAVIVKRYLTRTEARADLAPPTATEERQPMTMGVLRGYFAAIGIVTLISLGATEIWYRTSDAKHAGIFQWDLNFPTNRLNYKTVQLTPRVSRSLGYDEGGAATWTGDRGEEWNVYFFRWNQRSLQSMFKARGHRPEVCLPASGFRQIGDFRIVSFSKETITLPFYSYIYEADGRVSYVFFCQWQDGFHQQMELAGAKQSDRIRSVLDARRRLAMQTLEILITNCATPEEAEARLRSTLPGLIRLQDPVSEPI